MTQQLQGVVDQVYREVADFYKSVAPKMGDLAAGYGILDGPATPNPATLFLGFQPGGNGSDAHPGIENGVLLPIPDTCVFAHATWPYARNMRRVWDASYLKTCNGINAIFFRAPRAHVWNQLPLSLKRELEEFSYERARRLVDALNPQRIVVIGLHTFSLIGGTPETVLSGTCRLVVKGEIWGRPALGTAHLSGARLKQNDWDLLKGYFSDNP